MAASTISSLREMALAVEFERGEARGRAEGRAQEAQVMLRRQLTAKFGPLSRAHEAQLESATLEQLEVFGERVIFADTIDAVLGE
jgi:hypothetical protein